MKMNLPNKLTTLRIFLIPIFLIFCILSVNYNEHLLIENNIDVYTITINNYHIDIYRLIAAIIFVVASFTDYLDGMLARKYHLITNYGKLMDPLADKMLVIAALMVLTHTKEVNFICTLIVILREIAISAIRLVACEQGIVIAASMWGKFKTASQMIAVVLYLFNVCTIGTVPCMIVDIIFYISMFFVVISFIDYVMKNKNAFLQGGI